MEHRGTSPVEYVCPMANNGNLTELTYGNSDSVSYTYDKFDRLIKMVYNDDSTELHYEYNAEGSLAKLTHQKGSVTLGVYTFEYDSLGRLIRSKQTDGTNTIQRTEHLYDTANRLSSQSWVVNGTSFSEQYEYSKTDGSLTNMTAATGDRIHYVYDSLKRLSGMQVTHEGSTKLSYQTVQQYYTLSGDRTSAETEYYTYLDANGNLIAGDKYAYDELGNITALYEAQPASGNAYRRKMVGYEYDSQNQLTKEIYYTYLPNSYNPSSTTTYEYTYDTAGNLLTESKNGTVTKTYTYGNSQWKDLLTKYTTGGVSYNLTYDAIGNPTTYYYGGKAYTLTWEHGRQLAGIRTKTDGSVATIDSESLSFRYDADGIRTEKSSGTGLSLTTHTYVTQNGKVIRETIKNRKSTQILDFLYDNAGKPFALKYQNGTASPVTYYYALNLQGDVVALMDKDGAVIARYTYSAWGEIRSVTDANGAAITSVSHIANLNPLRYRGYYYDTETGFYYLQSRYYDPITHRFINADAAEYSTLTGDSLNASNLYAYCYNNPLSYTDTIGEAPDRTDEFVKLLENNYYIAKKWVHSFTGIYKFYKHVRSGGEWDYKQKDNYPDWMPEDGIFEVNGVEVTAEELGNINYGLTGRAMHFISSVLYIAGGLVAIKNNGIKWSDWWTDFDSKEDHESIRKGILIYSKISRIIRPKTMSKAVKEIIK